MGKFLLQGELNLFSTCFSYESASLSVLNSTHPRVCDQQQHQIADLTTVKKWFSSFFFSVFPVYRVQGFVVHWFVPCCGRGQFGLCHNMYHSKKPRASSVFLGISNKELCCESIVGTTPDGKNHWIYQVTQAFCYKTV